MDIRKVKKLIELLEESGIAEIEIKEGEEAVRISRMPTGAYANPQPYMMHAPAAIAAPVAAPPPVEAPPAETGDSDVIQSPTMKVNPLIAVFAHAFCD